MNALAIITSDDDIDAEFQQAFRDRRAAAQRKRNARMGKQGRSYVYLRAWLAQQQGNRCYHCGCEMTPVEPMAPGQRPLGTMLTLEHLDDLAEGGSIDPDNCVAACHRCNTLFGLLNQRRRALEGTMFDAPAYEVHRRARRLAEMLDRFERRFAGGAA